MTDLTNTYFPIKDGRHAFAPTLETVRKHQFPTTPLWKQGIISRDKVETQASPHPSTNVSLEIRGKNKGRPYDKDS